MSNYDLDSIADLVRAGDRLNIRPYGGEDASDFARRLANEVQRPRNRLLPIAGRLALSVVLAAFGIASF